MPANRGYLPTLDGWRAIAILSVLSSHLTFWVPMHRSLQIFLNGIGLKGVELFFGISGLLITFRLIEECRERQRVSLSQFYIRRAFRILPPAMTYLAAIALLGAAHVIPDPSSGLLAALFFMRNYFGGSWFTGHFWSLAVEEHFYFLWPWVFALCSRKVACRIAVAAILAVTMWRAYLWIPLGNVRTLPWFFYRTDTRMDALLCGALTAILIDRYTERAARYLKPAVVLPVLGAILVPLIGVAGPLNSVARLGQAIIIPLIITSTVLNPGSWFSLALEIRPMRWVGRLSYSLYLWQQLFLGTGLRWWPLKLAACFACAAASYYLVERPAIRLGHRLAPPATEGRGDMEREAAVDAPKPSVCLT